MSDRHVHKPYAVREDTPINARKPGNFAKSKAIFRSKHIPESEEIIQDIERKEEANVNLRPHEAAAESEKDLCPFIIAQLRELIKRNSSMKRWRTSLLRQLTPLIDKYCDLLHEENMHHPRHTFQQKS
jgi:hypothetical protein